MTADTLTISALADEAYSSMELRTRADGTDYYTTKDDAADWVRDLVYAAHNDGDMLPDDWRYDCIHSALSHISDAGAETADDLDDAGHDFADSHADVYTSDLLAWAASNAYRLGYVDEARSEGLIPDDADEARRLMIGQYCEALEVFESVRRSLADRLDELTD